MKMIFCIVAPILLLRAPVVIADEYKSPIRAFVSPYRPAQTSSSRRSSQHHHVAFLGPRSSEDADDVGCMFVGVGDKQILIKQVGLDDEDELELMSKFCIDAFYGSARDKEESFLSR